MPLVPCQCPNCKAPLNVDRTKEATICEYCGTPFITEKAINSYNIINNITAGVVNVLGGNSEDFVIRAGVLEKYKGASTEVAIPNSVVEISGGAFSRCHRIKSVIIPDSVIQIGEGAFFSCTDLEMVRLPHGLKQLHGFDNCISLKSITIPESVTILGGFSGCTGLTELSIPDGVTRILDNAFSDCTGLKSVTISDNVKTIPSGAFSNCTALEKVILPRGITSIRTGAFTKCVKLSNIIFPKSIVELGGFERCTSLKNVLIPDGVTDISWKAFKECASLTSISIPNSVILIRAEAFCDCGNLDNVIIPNSVTEIGYKAFRGCKSISQLPVGFRAKRYDGYLTSPIEKIEKTTNNRGCLGCYIATSVYGSYDCPPVWTLRRYRDYTLDSTWYGRAFIKTYYAISPTLVKWFGHTAWFQRFWRCRLDKMVERLNKQGVKDTPYQDKQY